MNTFEKYYQRFPQFIDEICKKNYDYLIPVAKKGAKLIKASKALDTLNSAKVRYKNHFEIFDINLYDKKIAVIDDATQFTATLLEYRKYFEKKGAKVDTYSFVGHNNIYTGENEQYDLNANIEIFLSDPIYQEYILQQSYFLLENGNQFDLDHLVFQYDIDEYKIKDFIQRLREMGIVLFLDDYFLKNNTYRFSLVNLNFNSIPYFDIPSIDMSYIKKIKFVYRKDQNKLFFSPLIFPTWNFSLDKNQEIEAKNIPFNLPFKSFTYDSKNRESIFRIYTIIQIIYSISLSKYFFQELKSKDIILENIVLKKSDLYALFGSQIANELVVSLKNFLFSDTIYDFTENRYSTKNDSNVFVKFHSFSKIFDKLRNAYEKEVYKNRSRVGVHKYFSYDYIFPRYKDILNLHENLDYFCDFGSIVPSNFIEKGKVLRGIRTGEPKSEYSWKRTQVLLPLVVDYVCSKLDDSSSGLSSMLYNKILANFAFDYSNTEYHELHCLIGQPYTFGTLTYVYHKLRAPNKYPIYYTRISPYLKYIKKDRKFITTNTSVYVDMINHYFDEQQEVGYSEIIQYLDLLVEIYKKYNRVDVLNLLSLCRDEDFFYSHILYNIKTWFSDYGNYLDFQSRSKKMESLHHSGENVNSALEKLKLMEESEFHYNQIRKEFKKNIRFVKISDKMLSSVTPVSSNFQLTLSYVATILHLQRILTNLSLYKEYDFDNKYKKTLDSLEYIKFCKSNNLHVPENLKENEDYKYFIRNCYEKLTLMVESLPKEKPFLESKLTRDLQRKARNRAKSIILENKIENGLILYVDFTGFRKIPDPKETIIAKYYKITREISAERGGLLLYGTNNGDDAVVIMLYDIRQALECVKDIKAEFQKEIFLSKYDVKFGLSRAQFSKNNIDTDLVNCWGEAKDCCEYKSSTFRNRGDLLITDKTFSFLKEKYIKISEHFSLTTSDGTVISYNSRYFRYTEIQSIN